MIVFRFSILLFLFLSLVTQVFAGINISRSSGPAPHFVFFNSDDLTLSSPGSMPFHDCEYSWNFGDSGAGNWPTTGMSKNVDRGAVASHVYETPGVYTATLTARGPSGVISTSSVEITVSDQDAVYSSATTCISDATANDFTGCPTGANHVSTDNISNLTAYMAEGKRILFRRGSSWDLSATPSLGSGNNQVISAYGNCSSHDELGICGNAPEISINGNATTDFFINLNGRSGTIISDISLVGVSARKAFSGANNHRNILISRVKTSGFFAGIETSLYNASLPNVIDSICIYSSKFTSNNTYQVYIGSERLSLIGNVFQDSDLSHVIRVWQSYKGVISHNIISGASYTNTAGRHALKLHSPREDTGICTPSVGNTCMEHRTEFTVVSDNIFGSSGPWPVSIGPENTVLDERVSDLVFEGNKVLPEYGNESVSVTRAVLVEGRYVTVRNNFIDGTGGGSDFNGVMITRRGIEPAPTGNRVFNNTIFSNSSHSSYINGVYVGSSATDTVVKNNLLVAPNATGSAVAVQDTSVGGNIDANVMSTSASILVSPIGDVLFRDFRINGTASSAISSGAEAPVYSDFFGNSRIGVVNDIGAHQFILGSSPSQAGGFKFGSGSARFGSGTLRIQ